MTPPVEAVRTGVYLQAAAAVPFVALRAAAGDLGALLGAPGDLRTAPVVLFAEIHHCKSRERGLMSHCLCNGPQTGLRVTSGPVAPCWCPLPPSPVASVLAFANPTILRLILSETRPKDIRPSAPLSHTASLTLGITFLREFGCLLVILGQLCVYMCV